MFAIQKPARGFSGRWGLGLLIKVYCKILAAGTGSILGKGGVI
jgi:hypothetical protein